ncbi:sigma70-ECF: RNA polymerase sigma factor, sigma-70 family [Gaiella occulta]|uniref:Sigma70-ECF: RNA polymerase sigma factor, sigma-70 family n=1 Tax=Gaiella occulta TaxID=1002870 RepID=A0A7M2YU33_9ACTN|nr:sigma-70 family RNA polymerase sigma factor [Gaiella occulta]RDI73642.1 sigma70-ECF: RNA polymerase sigma factor, sigma-70 family [Gaiella occulta]
MAQTTRARPFARQSDEHLSRRLALGEAAAFDELYRRYAHRLAAYGAHLLGDGAAGDDVAQVALLNAYQALRSGTQPERVRPWLYRIAHNAALDSLERRVFPAAEPRPVETAAPEAGSPSLPGGALVAALEQLSERQRRVYLLRELHGLRVAEIAATLSLTAEQVEQTLFAARNGLAETLVFGGRLDCDAVRRLSAGPLEWREQRALQRHLRACAACREVVPRRRVAPVLLPFLPVDWLLRQFARAVHWSPAAKVGAIAATTAVVAAPPLAVRQLAHDSHKARQAPRQGPSGGSARTTSARKQGATEVRAAAASSPLAGRRADSPRDGAVAPPGDETAKAAVTQTDPSHAASDRAPTTAPGDQGDASALPAQPAAKPAVQPAARPREHPEASERETPETETPEAG